MMRTLSIFGLMPFLSNVNPRKVNEGTPKMHLSLRSRKPSSFKIVNTARIRAFNYSSDSADIKISS